MVRCLLRVGLATVAASKLLDMDEIVKSPHYERWMIDISRARQIELGLTEPDLTYFGRKSYDVKFNDEVQHWLGDNVVGHPRYDKLYDLAVWRAQGSAQMTFWTARDAVLFKLFWL